ncbi:hypothetical protein ACT3CD_13010 [Geofilum sp. OHC36d9]|uniref:hypothetical protein n=1 Tax=Geofilum sp. OHC36d9 TaxID=3458413 RepID=UPI0040338E3A
MKFKFKACEVIKIKGLTNEVKAETKLLLWIYLINALIMLYKEEEDEVSLLFVNDCFYDKRNAEVDFIDKH